MKTWPATSATDAPQRRIAHLDMDAFFASVELLRYPQLAGLPLVIGGRSTGAQDAALSADSPLSQFGRLRDYRGRGVIATATYAARQFGVGSAMGLMKAARLCPQAVLLPADFAQYRRCSRAFKQVICEIAPVIEDRGIDEVFIDFTDVPGGQREGGRVLARLIQKCIADATGLTCSVGVAPNRLLAKMVSEFNKPNGISLLFEEDIQAQIWPLPCRKINGIGPRTDARLAQHNIHSIGELAQCSLQWLLDTFGQGTGAWLHNAAWGRDDSPLRTHREPVSMSRETTFERDLHAVRDQAALSAIFTRLCDQVAADLARKGYVGKTVGIKLRYADFRITTRDQSLDHGVCAAADIRRAAGQCLKRVPLQQPLRLLGVRVGGLVKADSAAAQPPAATADGGMRELPLF